MPESELLFGENKKGFHKNVEAVLVKSKKVWF